MFVQTNTIHAIKSYFRDRLKDHFSDHEIRFMLKEAIIDRLKMDHQQYILADDQLLSESDLLYFRSIVKRLLNNEPFQYILGRTEFYGLTIKTDKRALIPRPETEELVQWVLESFPTDSKIKILDLCTGTGCIALALKANLKDSIVEASDLSLEALNLTEENASELDLKIHTVHFDATKADSYSILDKGSYDCWVSNPPYIPEKEKLQMLENVTVHEPGMALFVTDSDPLIFYRTIGEQGMIYLKSGGKLFFEIHEDHGKDTVELLQKLGYRNVELRKDLQGKDRMIKAELV